MTNTILVLQDVYNATICIAADAIESYAPIGDFVNLTTKSGNTYNINISVERLNAALSETYFMVKTVL